MKPLTPFRSTDPRVAPAPTPQPEEDENDVCPECGGDGSDKWNDGVLPCPLCNGERHL